MSITNADENILKIKETGFGLGNLTQSSTSKLSINVSNQQNSSTFGDSMVDSSGFYYDKQKSNELISVSLHPNRVTTDKGKTWNVTSEARDVDDYRMRPICTSIMSEDYQVAISNSWTDLGDDMIRQLWSQVQPAAPYLDRMLDSFKEMNEVEDEMEKEDDIATESKIVQFLMNLTDIAEGGAEVLKQYTNRGIVSKKYARMTYYQGTGVGFGNLNLKFTVFADWINGEFKSCDDQLQELYPYCFGYYTEAVNSYNGSNETVEFVVNKANELFGWQLPPGGFEADIHTIDSVNVGTLKLKFGAFYSIDNLVIENAQFQSSKQMVKYRSSDTGKNKITPLFCDVTLSLKPATKFTDARLSSIISGSKMSVEREAMESVLKQNLDNERDKINILLGN